MKILVIEDDPNVVMVIRSSFELGWPEAKIVSTHLGEEGISMVETEVPDAVILDLGLPDIDGLNVLKQIRLFSQVPILILTVAREESDVINGLTGGADDYLTKPFRQMELLARIKVITRRVAKLGEDLSISCGLFHFNTSILDLVYGDKKIKLTRIEGEILYELMRTPNKVVKAEHLADVVWGDNLADTSGRLRVHIKRLREKIEKDPSKPEHIINKPCLGYILLCPPQKKA